MKKIGCFRHEKDQQGGNKFSGNITTLQFSVQVQIIPNNRKIALEDPDFVVIQTKASGYAPEIGLGWMRKSSDGTPYMAIEIDDPSCQRPILANLWEAEAGLWYLFWNRYASGVSNAESLYVQEELKPPMAWHRVPQKMTTYLRELFPQLVV